MNSIKLKSACALALLAAVSPTAYGMSPGTANAGEDTQMAAGIDIAGQLPVGNFADVAGFGLGALGRFEYNLNESPLALTARVGYLHHLDKDGAGGTFGVAQVPILGGVKYSLPTAPIYIAGEVGAVMLMTKFEGSGFVPDSDDSQTNLGFTVGAGYELGDVDIRMSVNVLDASNMADAMAIGVTFGYNFWGM